MNAVRIRAELDELIDRAKRLRDQLAASSDAAESDPIYMTIDDYAKRAEVSSMTVRRWLRLGLPAVRRGRVVRIKVADADKWNVDDALRGAAAVISQKG